MAECNKNYNKLFQNLMNNISIYIQKITRNSTCVATNATASVTLNSLIQN